MKLIIFGSTGSIGRQLVGQALTMEYDVTAFERDPGLLNGLEHPHLSIFKGDVYNIDTVNKAVEGNDAVLCALGAGRNGGVRAIGTRNIIRADVALFMLMQLTTDMYVHKTPGLSY